MATWQSFLCQGSWAWPTTYGNSIVFNDDGTGELHCGVSPAAFISAELLWKPVGDTSASALQQPVDHENLRIEDIQATVDIELTLSSRLVQREHGRTNPDLNELNLKIAAFQPKTYRLQMARGKFTADKWFCFNNPLDSTENSNVLKAFDGYYKFRVVFDHSPFPPLEEWVEKENPVNRAIRMYKFWEFRDFYRDWSFNER